MMTNAEFRWALADKLQAVVGSMDIEGQVPPDTVIVTIQVEGVAPAMAGEMRTQNGADARTLRAFIGCRTVVDGATEDGCSCHPLRFGLSRTL
jgi:hypothetical protein